ncbi:unnamed protein product [Ixodes pacificus]
MLKKYEERTIVDQTPQRASVAFHDGNVEEEDLPCATLQQNETYRDVKISRELTADQRAQVSRPLPTYQESLSDVPGRTHLVECKLKVTTDTPIQVHQYPIPFSIQETVQEERHCFHFCYNGASLRPPSPPIKHPS